MHIKKGDNVKVIAGKDKGKEGKVVATEPKKDRVVVEGVNTIKKHQKPTQFNPEGGILETEAAIHVSNVQLLEDRKSTRLNSSHVASSYAVFCLKKRTQ